MKARGGRACGAHTGATAPCLQVARAPRHAAPRAHAVAEAARDQAWVPAGAGEGLDLSLLTACLCPSELVRRGWGGLTLQLVAIGG